MDDHHRHGGHEDAHDPLRTEAHQDAGDGAYHGQQEGFPHQYGHDIAGRSSQRLQNSDFTGAFQHGRVHREKHHQETNDYGEPDDDLGKALEDGDAVD